MLSLKCRCHTGMIPEGGPAEDVDSRIGVQQSDRLSSCRASRVRSTQALDLLGIVSVGTGLGALPEPPGKLNALADVGAVRPTADEAVLGQLFDQLGTSPRGRRGRPGIWCV